MNILYYSVHHILEDDEVRLFQNLGHDVFCLGVNSKHGASQAFRPAINFNARENHLYHIYEAQGGKYFSTQDQDDLLPHGFVGNFSLSVIMHDAGFILSQWHKLRVRPVIWRTIGQGVDAYDNLLTDLRHDGLSIVRYSDIEKEVENSLGQEDIIRFYKSAEQYRGWTGVNQSVLTFSNAFEQRYPRDAADYRAIVDRLPSLLGGSNNESFPQSIGFVDHRDQVNLYRTSRAYLYANGMDIPYTLNFIEAWMTGLPIVVYAPNDRKGKFFEVDRLIEHGRTGFVCRTIECAREHLQMLLNDPDLATRISAAGRAEAIRRFGPEKIGNQWQAMFGNLTKT